MAMLIDSVRGIEGIYGTVASRFTVARQRAFNAAADELGMSPTELRSAVASGASLTKLAIGIGISPGALRSTIETTLNRGLLGVPASQLAALAARMMAGQPQEGSPLESSDDNAQIHLVV